MIKLVIFDLAGVCMEEADYACISELCEKYELNIDDFYDDYYERIKEAELDKSTVEEVWEGLKEKYGLEESPLMIRKRMDELRVFIPETMEIVKDLKGKVTLAFLTNEAKSNYEDFKDRMNDFDFGYCSYEIKARKPAKEAFLPFLEREGVKPEEVIFLDNKEGNLSGAKEMGIHTIHFKGAEQLKNELTNLGVS